MHDLKKSKKIIGILICMMLFITNFISKYTLNVEATDINTGLIAYWNFNEDNGLIVRDVSGYGNNGTIKNSASRTTGKIGFGIEINSTVAGTSYVGDIPNSYDDSITNEFTIAAWVYWDGENNYGTNSLIFDDRYDFVNGLCFFIGASDNKLKFNIDNHIYTINSTHNITKRNWTHVAVVFYLNNLKLYLNGSLDKSVAITDGHINNINKPVIGNNCDISNPAPLNGILDELRIYNRALSNSEILELYNQNVTEVYVDYNFTSSTSGWGYDHFNNIQDAIDTVDEGGTVRIYNGTYYECNITVNKIGLNIIGETTNSVIINVDYTNSSYGMKIIANNVSVENLNISNTKNGSGIIIDNADNVTLSNLSIYDIGITSNSGGWGILINNSNYCNILSSNAISRIAYDGIHLEDSNYNYISSNIIRDTCDNGIEIVRSSNNIISNNNISEIYLAGLYLNTNCHENNISSNDIHDNRNNKTNFTAANNGIGLFLYVTNNNNIISSNYIYNNRLYGINIAVECNNNNISSNYIYNNSEYGIYIEESGGNSNSIWNNNFSNQNNAKDECNNKWNASITNGTNIVGGPKIGGNYWSNYTGFDTDHDGIGDNDTQYVNGSHNESGEILYSRDYYPLVISPAVKLSSCTPNGTSIDVSTPVIIYFNKSMNQTKTENNITTSFSPSSKRWSNNNQTLTLYHSNLAYKSTYNITINRDAADENGNVMLRNYSWTFTTKDNSEGGDGDGGSDGISTPPTNITQEKNETTNDNSTNNNTPLILNLTSQTITIGDLTKGSIIETNLTETIIKIIIKPAKNLQNVNLNILENSTNPQENITNILDEDDLINNSYLIENFTIYKYITIKLTSNNTYISQDDLESVKILFKLENSWITKYNFNKTQDIYLLRYHNDTWNKLKITNYGGNQTNYSYFEAETPGFSTFAVVGSKIIEKGETYTDKKDEIPWILIISFIISTIIIVIIILFKTGFIYLEKIEKEEKPGNKL